MRLLNKEEIENSNFFGPFLVEGLTNNTTYCIKIANLMLHLVAFSLQLHPFFGKITKNNLAIGG
jgi:hypothetical protein